MTGKRRSKKAARLVFFVPVAVVLLVVVAGLFLYAADQSGTLVVEAVTSGRYSASVPVHVRVSIGGATETTPFNFTLPQGEYTVYYGPAAGYHTPPPRSIFLSGGRTEYAIASYDPVIEVVSVTQGGFNTTALHVLHGVTPVVWINNGGNVVVLQIDTIGSFPIYPAQNYSQVFNLKGTYVFSITHTTFSGQVIVS